MARNCCDCGTLLQSSPALDPALTVCHWCGLVYFGQIAPSAVQSCRQEELATLQERLAKLEAELASLTQQLKRGLPVRVSPEFASVAEQEALRLPKPWLIA